MAWVTLANAIVSLALSILQWRSDAGKADAAQAQVYAQAYQKALNDVEESKKIQEDVHAMPDDELNDVLRGTSKGSASDSGKPTSNH